MIRDNIHKSAVYSGQIAGTGPRYCPSIEDKIVRFAGKDRHNIFLEPEGLDDPTIYPNGISTSLPEDVQRAILHTIPGLEQCPHDPAGLRGGVRLRRSPGADAGAWNCARCPGCSWRDRSTGRPDTRKPPRRACSRD